MFTAQDDAWSPPATFDGFELRSLIGQGGMGRVYLAHEVALDRPVAIKFILDALTPRARERFLTEARAVARLQHANIVAVYRIGEVGAQPYVAYEYISGRSLDDFPLPAPWPDVLRIGLGMARALSAAHARGVLHRDVKPANVLETASGEIKLVDFGLAKLAEPSEGEAAASSSAPFDPNLLEHADRTATGTLVGTPLYVAPELWQGEPATPVSDVFAAGLVMYELATGALPHADLTPPEIARAVVSHDLPPITVMRPDFPLALARVIERAAQRLPGDRFTSADELLQALASLDAVFSSFRTLAPPKADTPGGATRVMASLGRVRPRSEELYTHVYAQLFVKRPELRALFPDDMTQQRAKLAAALQLLVENLREPAHIVTVLEELGNRHVTYGATAEHLATLGDVLLTSLELFDPMPWDGETRDAWRSAYGAISLAMQRGLRSGTVTKPDFRLQSVDSDALKQRTQ
jgi:eukaryotic-like serine/threonine-protein kinase